MQPLRIYRRSGAPEPYEVVDDLYAVVEHMKAIDKTFRQFWTHLGDREPAVEGALTDYDFLMRARALEAVADAWQNELDGEAS